MRVLFTYFRIRFCYGGIFGKSTSRGFTLLELLISVAVLGLLAVVVLVVVNPVRRQNQAKDATIRSDIGQISTAAQSYFASQSGSYPQTLDSLVINGDLKNVPIPPNATAYTYVVTNAGFGVCDGTINNPCALARISNVLTDPVSSGNLWCWQSSTGKAQEVAPAACTP